MFRVPESLRVTDHPILKSDKYYENNGAFKIPLGKGLFAWCIASDGEGWEHVSVHIGVDNGAPLQRCPTWEEMCKVKDLFWSSEDCVIQFHPPKSEYVNNHKSTLHLWKPTMAEILIPDSILVGIK